MKYWLTVGSATLLGFLALVGRPANLPNLNSPAPADVISIASLNLAHEQKFEKVMHDVEAAPRLRSADILLLQEVANEDGSASIASKLADRMGYAVAFSAEGETIHDRGLAVVSKFPIEESKVEWLRPFNLVFKTRRRFALAVKIRAPSGDLRIWNTHLDTRINPDQRLDQLQPLMDAAAKATGPRLIGGDFNTNDFYWIDHVLPIPHGGGYRSTVRRSMAQYGFQTPFADQLTTLPILRQHLDWLFVNGLDPLNSSAEPIAFSDHHAVWATFRVRR